LKSFGYEIFGKNKKDMVYLSSDVL